MDACQRAFEEILQQPVGFVEARIVGDPYRAGIHRQFTPGSGQHIAADDGLDAIGFEKSADQMGIGQMAGVVDSFHDVVKAMSSGGAGQDRTSVGVGVRRMGW